MKEPKTLKQLTIPITLETLCYMLAGMIDTLMLSSVGDEAVGAVGTANTYISMFVIMFSIISNGAVAVMTQYIGAKKEGVAYQARNLGLIFNGSVGILLGFILYYFAGNILNSVGIAPNLSNYAVTYMKIVGGSCILNALIPIFSSYLRAFGHTKGPLIATIIGNVVNLIFNSISLYILKWGVAGVACATVLSRVVNLAIVIVLGKMIIHAKEDPNRKKKRHIFNMILKVGLPSALETMAYNIAMTFIISFLNKMDSTGFYVTSRSYATQIANFSFCFGAALAQANAIQTGWRLGAGDYDRCDKGTRKAALVGAVCASVFEGVIALAAPLYMPLFTNDPRMALIVQQILFVDIILEFGRVTNLVYGQALKTSGDGLFTLIIAVIFMYLCAVGGTYLLGIHLGLFVVGAHMAAASDEIVRAICMGLRWRQGKWRKKALIK